MKRLILFELIVLFLATTFESDSPPGWFQQTIAIGNRTITDIFFTDTLNGWVVTDAGSGGLDTGLIFKTIDGGNNWTIQYRTFAKLNAVQFLDVNTGYCAGDIANGILLKTTNSGSNWNLTYSAGQNFKDIFFVNKDTGWICDEVPTFGVGLIKTTNGGLNWQQQANASFTPKKLYFLNQDTGWFAGQNTRLYFTTNGGTNWNLQFTFATGPTDIFFTDRDTGWVTAGPTGIMKSINGGFNWFSQTSPSTVSGESKLFFINNKQGYIGAFSNRIIVTKDGLNWGNQSTPAFSNFSVYFSDTLNGWAGTSILIHTDDGGGPITYTGIGINPNSGVIPSFNLKQNYPNPFNPTTNITFEVTRNSKISLKIFNILGEEIDELIDYEDHNTGTYTINFEADDDIPSGVYFYQITAWTENKKEIFIDTKKMILLK